MDKRRRFGKCGDANRIAGPRQAGALPSHTPGRGVNVRGGPSLQRKGAGHAYQVTVRSAGPADVEYVRSLGNRVFRRYGPYESILTEWFESRATVTLVALMEKQLVGFAMLGRLEREWHLTRVCELLAIAVEPAKWKLGIGDLLMNEVVGKAQRINAEILILHTAADNVRGQKLFKKHGFSVFGVKESFYPKGQDALVMYNNVC